MSLLLIAAAAAAAAGAAGFFAARRTSHRDEAPPAPSVTGSVTPPPPPRFASVPVQLGDVVVCDRDERWLTGALVVEEGSELVALVLAASDRGQTGYVAAFPVPRRDIFWLGRVEGEVGAQAPTSFEARGIVLQRTRRLPVTIRRLGEGILELVGEATFAEYAASDGDRAIVLLQGSQVLALVGKQVPPGGFDVLGSGAQGAT